MLNVVVIYSYPPDAEHGKKILEVVLNTLNQQQLNYTLIDLYSENFNPVLSVEEYKNYGNYTSYDVAKYQQKLKAAQIYIFLYPVWWSSPPAILKGFIDRVFLPNFAFKFENNALKGLLDGKVALVICSYGSSAKEQQELGFISKKFIEKAVLESCGIKSQIFEIYSIDKMDKTVFEHVLFQVPGAISRIIAFYKNLFREQKSLKEMIEKSQQKQALASEKLLKQKELEDLKYFQKEQKKAKQKARKSKRF
ncbi:MAG: NAD(P)H-dependent oxidoreductase [Candidatus Micrarchaeota archaeon]|nr:NAD(P)H-dependent oxidoreductase [Candidatus Micrarchaeota archaeon]